MELFVHVLELIIDPLLGFFGEFGAVFSSHDGANANLNGHGAVVDAMVVLADGLVIDPGVINSWVFDGDGY